MNQETFTIKIGGQAGQGIKSAGLMLAKVANRLGFHIYNYSEYPSLIRGGHNTIQINIGQNPVTSPCQKTDLLIALDQGTISLDGKQLPVGSGIIFDAEAEFDLSALNSEVTRYPLPLSKLAKESGGGELLSNTAALGATLALLGADLNLLQNLISEELGNKGLVVLESNKKAAEAGFNFAKQQFADKISQILSPLPDPTPKIVVNGNDAIALGAISAGMQFAVIYPMTPISGLIPILASSQEKYNFIYKQPEDEIAAINMAIGASFAGVRSMTATSGGGFCLMTEGLSLAGMTETPLVVILGMRPGPSTGLATWSDQGDLQFILHSGQGEFPRLVLAAGDPQEAFELTYQAFNLADKYQTAVVVIVDKNICESEQSFIPFDTNQEINRGKLVNSAIPNYERYTLQPDGISPRAVPGSGNFFIGNSYAHTSIGFTTEDAQQASAQMEKRMTKLVTCEREDLPTPKLFGPQEADLTIVSWGSNKGAILQALKNFPNVNFLHLTWLNPFPADAVRNILAKSTFILDIEANFSGQLAALIREKTGIEATDKLLKFDGRPIFPEEISQRINTILQAKPDSKNKIPEQIINYHV